MDFGTASMMSRRYGLPFEYNVEVVDAYIQLANSRKMGWTVFASIIVDGEKKLVSHWYTHMTKAQATKLVAAVKVANTFDAGMWCYI